MNKLYNNAFADLIRQRINNGDFKDKSDLVNYLKNINSIVMNNSELMQRLKEDGIVLNGDELEDIAKLLLEYYDKQKTDLTSLNLDNVSQFKTDGKEDYIKYKKADGSYVILNDSMDDKDLAKQMLERQNELFDSQTSNADKNTEAIINDMEKDKQTVKLTASTNVDLSDLSPEEKKEFKTIMGINDADEINWIVNTEENIYINKNTGETYYAYKNQFNQMEVRKINETTGKTMKNGQSGINQNQTEQTMSTNSADNINFEDFSEYELQTIADTRMNSLTPEQQQIVLQLLERKKEMKTAGNETITNQNEYGGKQYVKNLVYNQRYNGFANAISLSFVTLIFGLLMLGFLIFKISI